MNLAFPAILLPLAAGFILAGIPDVARTGGAFKEIGYRLRSSTAPGVGPFCPSSDVPRRGD
jgi:hypothetical protein